ncbi:MAG: crossover junction endodeoxyribonuclease RuvC [Saprospiraceae bacterium]|nr:crossover junction endodeoxyribonuclease RuvC [Saprospiraceae bacterium]
MSRRTIIGVDPGTNVLGFAVVVAQPHQYTIKDVGVLHLKKFGDHQTKLKEIFLQLQEIIETYLPSDMAIEAPFYGKNPQSMLKLGRAQGVAMTAAMTMGLGIYEYSPKRIKQSVTGNGNASKEQVAAMIESITKRSVSHLKLDATDALATAICHYHSMGVTQGNSKNYNSWESFIKSNPGKIK